MKKFILGFFLGGAIAGGSTFFITKKYVEDRCQEEVNKLKSYYKNKYEGKNDISEEEKEAIKNHVKKVPDKPVPPEYKKEVKKYQSDDIKEDVDLAEAESPEEDHADVEIISQDEFEAINHEFEHSCLMYYVNDMQLATEDGEMIDNEKYLLEGALDIDGWRNNDDMEQNIYVRNNKISEMFEVCKVFGAYGDLN